MWSSSLQSELEKPRSRKKAPVTDPEEKLGMDDLTKLVQEQKPKGSQRRKRGHVASESEEQQWPEEKRHKEELLENEDEQNSPPKKGKRGRPPKPLGGGTSKEEPTVKTSKKGNKKKPVPPVVDEDEEEERQIGNTEQKSKSKQHRTSKRAQQRWVCVTLNCNHRYSKYTYHNVNHNLMLSTFGSSPKQSRISWN